jgi:hypothetical protein
MSTLDLAGFFPHYGDQAPEAPYRGDMVLLERGLTPTEAHLLAGRLQAAGIHADAGDTNIVQAHALISIAVGGANVRVASTQLVQAQELMAAIQRGDLALGDDFDVDQVPVK